MPKCKKCLHKTRDDGYCAHCKSEYNRIYVKKNHAREIARAIVYRTKHKEMIRQKALSRFHALSPRKRRRHNALHKLWFKNLSPKRLAKYRKERLDAENRRRIEKRELILALKRDHYSRRQQRIKRRRCTMSLSCAEPLAGTTRFCLKHWLVYIAAAATHRNNYAFQKVDYLDLLMIWNRQKERCAISGHILVPGNGASLDHIRPVNRGGDNNPKNLRFIYQTINRIKDDMLDSEFKRFLLKYWEPVIRWAKRG